MAEIRWIKIATDIFNNEKIMVIESMPDGDSIIVIWFKILMLAGTLNDKGNVYFTKDIPYTEPMLATVFNRPITTIQLALTTFEKFGMIEIVDDIIHVSNWEKYQNIDGMEKIREQTRLRVAKCRENKKIECNATCNATVTQSNGTEEEKEEELELEIDKNSIVNTSCSEQSQIASEPNEPETYFISFPLNDGTDYLVPNKDVEEWKNLYPAVNVEQELRKMRGWLLADKSRRKTKRGINRFINGWLCREQDRNPNRKINNGFNADDFLSKRGN